MKKKHLAILAILSLLALAVHLWVPRPLFSDPVSTVVECSDGNLLSARIAADGQWRFPEPDSVCQRMALCLVQAEDRRFRWHLGVDVIALCRAAVSCARAGRVVQGGSTITMQVARMARGHRTRSFMQKVVEIIWAVDIELSYSKDEILAIYAAHAPFGGNVVGAEAAAWRYFGRSPSDLSWAECATLAVLPNSPSLINVGRNRDALRAKRDRLLASLHADGFIPDLDYELALAEGLPLQPMMLPDKTLHLAAGWGGQRLRSSLSRDVQTRVASMADSYARKLRSRTISDLGVLVADVHTGQVVAYVGNSSLPGPTRHVDMVRAERSTGSVLKPMLYAAMVSDGIAAPRALVPDVPLDLNGFRPHNYSHTYSGAVHADVALTRSLNVPLVRMLTSYGISRFMGVLKGMGITTLHYDEDHYGASLILGGAEATLWDLVGAYVHMANCVLSPEADSVPSLSIRAGSLRRVPRTGAISPAGAWCAIEALTGLSRPEEESQWENFSSSRRIAWKTGTSFGNRDAWAIGLTPDYAVGVWVGCATGEGRADMTGVSFAGPLMLDVFRALPASSDWFQAPLGEMDFARVCRHSGCLASSVCAEVDTVVVPVASLGTAQCPYCRIVHLSADRRHQVNSSCCSVTEMVSESRFVLPPTMEFYYRQRVPTYQPLPPLAPECASSLTSISVQYPMPGQVVVPVVGLDGQEHDVVFSATARDGSASLYWHIDGDFVQTTVNNHRIGVRPSRGRHVLTVVNDDGESVRVPFSVE